MTGTQVTKGIELKSGYYEFTLDARSSQEVLTLTLKRLAESNRDEETQFSMYVTPAQVDDIINTLKELLVLIK